MTAYAELKRIENLLKANNVPEEVFIGTNSVYDKVVWLTNRVRLLERQRATLNAELLLVKTKEGTPTGEG